MDIQLKGCWKGTLDKVCETGPITTYNNIETLFNTAEEVHVFFDVKEMYQFILEKL